MESIIRNKIDRDLEILITKPKHVGRPPVPKAENIEDIIKFFNDRNISQAKIAIVFKVKPPCVCSWFNKRMPPHREKQFRKLMGKIVKWEADNGKQFGS